MHWLPLKQRIIFKLLLFVYKNPQQSGSSSDPLRLTYSVTRTLAGDRTFTVSASKYWNDLPLIVKIQDSNLFNHKTNKRTNEK